MFIDDRSAGTSARGRVSAALLAVALGISPFAPGFAQAAGEQPSVADPTATVTDRLGFAERAMAGNQFEIESSKLALERSKTREVRDFAERMIADHGVAAEKMKQALAEDQLSATGALSQTQQESLRALREAPDDQFDMTYLSAQMTAHEEAVGLFDGYIKKGEEGALHGFAETTMPALVMHRKQVHEIAGQ